MNRRALRPEVLWLLLAALVLLLVLLGAGGYVIAKHRWAGDLISQLEPRHARLAGLRADGERLRSTEQALAANLAGLAHGADGDAALAGNTALQHLRDASAARGLKVASSQVLPAREDGDFLRIGVTLRLEGELPALRDFLRDMATQRPTIFVDTLRLTRQSQRADSQAMTAQLELFVLKVRS